jgi:hypothetical protein
MTGVNSVRQATYYNSRQSLKAKDEARV